MAAAGRGRARGAGLAGLVAVFLVSACSGPSGAPAPGPAASPTYAPDAECRAAIPFLKRYDEVTGIFDPQLEAARQRVNAAQDESASRAALQHLAGVLEAYSTALGTLPPLPTDASVGSSVASASGRLANEARIVSAQPAGGRDVAAFAAAAGERAVATRELALHAAYLRAECL